MKFKTSRTDAIKKMAAVGVFCALAYICVAVFRIKVSFLTLDIKDAVITSGAMMLGPIVGIVVSLIVALIEMVTISETMLYGFIMNFLSSATFSAVASLFYRNKRDLIGAVLGLVCAVFSVTAVMLLANLFITPFYMGVDRSTVAALIPKLLLPFNLTKAVLNSAIVMIIYKPISSALKRAKLIKSSSENQNGYRLDRRTLLVTLAAITVLVISLVIFFVVLKAKIDLF